MNPNETVIVIRSLVPGGVAQMDGRAGAEGRAEGDSPDRGGEAASHPRQHLSQPG
ncbi:UNVERIFIED_CONTAM: hypothetical protein PYX00_000801 [Menopon gallinae]|uniref:Uncharacterized protein n=1 Tax=Menopon gallinae TaxID=328185 RepID=A0AAW2IBM2_9NEOP